MTRRPQNNLELIQRVLGTEYLEHQIVGLVLEEDFADEKSLVKVDLQGAEGNVYRLEGVGVGLVDALTHAFLQRFAPEYHSLESIEFTGFTVSGNFDTKNERSGSDAVGEVALQVRNSEGTQFTFADASRSIASSAARAVLASVEYFVNAERAYITLYKALKDAKDRDRPDLVTRYTRELAEVVKSTSYAEVIDKIRRELS